jgi:hypothetical protein
MAESMTNNATEVVNESDEYMLELTTRGVKVRPPEINPAAVNKAQPNWMTSNETDPERYDAYFRNACSC